MQSQCLVLLTLMDKACLRHACMDKLVHLTDDFLMSLKKRILQQTCDRNCLLMFAPVSFFETYDSLIPQRRIAMFSHHNFLA